MDEPIGRELRAPEIIRRRIPNPHKGPIASRRDIQHRLIARDLSRHGKQAVELLGELESCQWNVTAAAQNLGISRMTLYRRMKQHGITPPR